MEITPEDSQQQSDPESLAREMAAARLSSLHPLYSERLWQGWRFRVQFDLTAQGLIATGLIVEPEDEDYPPGKGINTTVLAKLGIAITEARAERRQQANDFLTRAAREGVDASAPGGRVLRFAGHIRDVKHQQGRPAAGSSQLATWAEDYIREVMGSRGYRERLAALPSWRHPEGPAPLSTVDTRVQKLKALGWIVGAGQSSEAGPSLVAWRQQSEGE